MFQLRKEGFLILLIFLYKNIFAEKFFLKSILEKEDYAGIVFTGKNYLSVKDFPSLNLKEGFTIEAWCKPKTLNGGYLILKKYSFGFPLFKGEGKVAWYLKTKNGDKSSTISDICKLNEWQHYVLTYDKKEVTIYYNGEAKVRYPFPEEVEVSKEPLLIANSGKWFEENFKGNVGLIRIYNRPLEKSEIGKEYINLLSKKEGIDFDSVIFEIPKKGSYYIFHNQELKFLVPSWNLEKKCYLSFEGRIETGGWLKTGSAPACIITVNKVPTSIERLSNKAPYYFFTSEERVFWFDENKNAWIFPYYLWEDKSKGEHIHKFVFDITDLMKERDNEIIFKSIYIYGGEDDKALEIRNVCLIDSEDFEKSEDFYRKDPPYKSHGLDYFRKKAKGIHKGVYVELNTKESFSPYVDFISPTKKYFVDFKYELLKTGNIKLIFKENNFEISTSIRFSGENWRHIGKENGKWDKFYITNNQINAETEKISWRRTIEKKDIYLKIQDTFTNKTNQDQPVMFINMIDLKDLRKICEFRVAGELKPSFSLCTNPMTGRTTSATPIVFVGLKDCGIGFVIEDDVYRNQATWLTWDSILASGTDLFYLKPLSSYTFIWKIYPLSKCDYYELINKVRYDWHLYQEIPGLFGFVHPYSKETMYEDVKYTTPQERAKFIEETGIKVASTSLKYVHREKGELNIWGGEPIEVHREAAKKFIKWKEDVLSQGVDVKCLPYLNIHLTRLMPEETLEDIKKRFPNGLPLNPWEEPVAYRTGWLYCILPTLDNKVGEHMMNIVKLYMDELKFDGIYLDEFDFSRAKVSFGHEDGYSALLDENGVIVRKIGFVPLLVKDFQITFVKEIKKRNGIIFANQFPSTLEVAQLPVIYFAEPVTYDSFLLYSAQICRTPLSLHLKPRVNLFENVKEFLKKGILTCYYWYYFHGDHILKRCYPIKVKEIYPGIIIGEDRIITCRSGKFTLGNDKSLIVYIYEGSDGLLKKEYKIEGDKKTGITIADIELNDNQIAVIVEN